MSDEHLFMSGQQDIAGAALAATTVSAGVAHTCRPRRSPAKSRSLLRRPQRRGRLPRRRPSPPRRRHRCARRARGGRSWRSAACTRTSASAAARRCATWASATSTAAPRTCALPIIIPSRQLCLVCARLVPSLEPRKEVACTLYSNDELDEREELFFFGVQLETARTASQS